MREPPNVIGMLATHYSARPEIQSLLKLIPYWDIADTLLQKRADEIKSDRVRTFFDELAQGRKELSDDLIQTEDFLHSYFCTLRAALNTRQREKIRQLARLLNSSLDDELHVTSDEYEELLSVLGEITLREFAILNDLREIELQHPPRTGENELQRSNQYWDGFKSITVKKYAVPEEAFNAFMVKLERTGLYLRLTGNFYDYSGDVGVTTPLLARLVELVARDAAQHIIPTDAK